MNYYLIHYRESTMYEFPNEGSKVVRADNPQMASIEIEEKYVITSIKMITNPDTTYTVLKNHLHNTLELTKEDIRSMVKEAIEDIVERRMDVFLDGSSSVERIIDDAVREKSWNRMLWGDSKKLDDVLQDKVVKEVARAMIASIGLDVVLKKKKQKATVPMGCPCVICSGYCACGIKGHHDV